MSEQRPATSIDDIGIVHRAEGTLGWPGVPDEFAELVTTSHNPAEMVASMVDGPAALPTSLQRSLLHPASALPAVLAPVGAGRSALDAGTGWFGLAPALASLGMSVTRADWSYPRLRFSRVVHPAPAITDVLIGRSRLADLGARFDVIFLDLEQVPPSARPGLLSGARLLLRPGGAVIAGVTDPRAVLVRAGSFAKALRAPSWRTVARRAGLVLHATHFCLPDRSAPQVVIPAARLAQEIGDRRRPTGVKAAASRLLRAAGGAAVLAPDRFLVLTPVGAVTGPSAASRVVGEQDEPLVLALSDARVGVLGSERFAKIALSTDQQRALMSEAHKARRARGTVFGPHVVEPEASSEEDGIVRVLYAAVTARPVSPEKAAAAVDSVLDKLDPSSMAALEDTPLWRRLVGDRGQRDIADLDAGPLWSWLQSRCAHRTVPVGPNHGDLHPDNLLVRADSGDPMLVDWNRFEEGNPLLLDPLYAAIGVEQVATGCSFADAFERAATGSLNGVLADRARQLLGELDIVEATALLLLDRVASYSLPRRRYKPWTLPQFEDALLRLSRLVTNDMRG